MDDYYDPTDEREAEGEQLRDDAEYERRSQVMHRIYGSFNWNELRAQHDARYEAWRLKPPAPIEAEECAA